MSEKEKMLNGELYDSNYNLTVCVLPGVTIGNNTIIGAGSVVTKDIPSNVVAVGNPCKVIKQI